MASITYYYYAYIEDGVCVDVERTRKEKTGEDMVDYVAITEEQYSASYNEETESPDYIIGMTWDGENWYLDTTNYYAIVDENFICRSFVASKDEITDPAYILTNKAVYDDQTYLNHKYDRETETFIEVPFSEYSNADTTMISVNGAEVTLQQTIEALQTAVENADVNITAEDVVSLFKTVDGEGSGVDCDTIDGHDSSEFLTVAAYNLASEETEVSATTRHNAVIELLNGISTSVSALTTMEQTLANIDTNTTNVPTIKQTVDSVNTTVAAISDIEKVVATINTNTTNVPAIQNTVDAVNSTVSAIPSMEYSLNEVYNNTSVLGNVNTLVNAINDKVNQVLLSSGTTSSAIKSIQRGISRIDEKSAFSTITLNQAIDPSKSIVILNGIRVIESGPDDDVLSFQPLCITDLTSTTLKVQSSMIYDGDTGIFSWQVVEFV